MQSLTANDAKTNFGKMLISAQSEPVEIIKNGTPVAVVLSTKEYQKLEELKMQLIRSRFDNIEKDDLVEGEQFFKDLDSGMYDK
jgi:prevent-host-death family protein